jgi:UDP-N-acetylglucosamine transferase subunit ALG13
VDGPRLHLADGDLDLADGDQPPTRKLLLVASTGGHLWQLTRLAPRLGASPESLWVTFDCPQSRSLLQGRRVLHVPYVAPRDVKESLRAAWQLRRAVREEHFDGVVSTGAAVAVSAMVGARARVPSRLYIESVSRFDGPSLTGRIIAGCRLARTLTQHPAWCDDRWEFRGSVLEDYVVEPGPAEPVSKVFVTMGTIRPYQFRRLAERVVDILPPGVEVVWQTGETDAQDLPGTVHRYLSGEDFDRAVRDAGAVITHAGIGTLLGLLRAGVQPIAVPRRARFGEHIDDHQQQGARALEDRGLVINREADELSWDDVLAAGRTRVRLLG